MAGLQQSAIAQQRDSHCEVQTTATEPNKLDFYVTGEGSMITLGLEAYDLIEFSKEVHMINGITRIRWVEGNHHVQIK